MVRKRLTFERKLGLIVDGNGYFAHYIHMDPVRKNMQGIIERPIIIIPLPETRDVYDFKETECFYVSGELAMELSFPDIHFRTLNDSPRDQVILLLCSFRGDLDTSALRDKQLFIEQNRKLQQENDALLKKVAAQDREINELMTDLASNLKKKAELFNALGVSFRKEEESEGEEKGK